MSCATFPIEISNPLPTLMTSPNPELDSIADKKAFTVSEI